MRAVGCVRTGTFPLPSACSLAGAKPIARSRYSPECTGRRRFLGSKCTFLRAAFRSTVAQLFYDLFKAGGKKKNAYREFARNFLGKNVNSFYSFPKPKVASCCTGRASSVRFNSILARSAPFTSRSPAIASMQICPGCGSLLGQSVRRLGANVQDSTSDIGETKCPPDGQAAGRRFHPYL